MNIELLATHIFNIYVSYFEFTTRRRGNATSNIDDMMIVDVYSRNRIAALRELRFFFDGKRFSAPVKLHYTISTWIFYVIGKNCSPVLEFSNGSWKIVTSRKNIISQHQNDIAITYEVMSN